MAGFANIAEYVNAYNNGQTWFTNFRKTVANVTTIAEGYIDLSYMSGSPAANFYASTPLESSRIDSRLGIYVPNVSPAKQYLKSITLMGQERLTTTTEARRQQQILLDYLLYYPFIDMSAVGEVQDMTQVDTIPRYPHGKVMAIAQSETSSAGRFTMTYTNQDGVSGRVTPEIFTQSVAAGGLSLLTHVSGAGRHPFIPLQGNDYGVQSIESVNFSVDGGGLLALVIVKPIEVLFISESCRRDTNESFGAANQTESITHKLPPAEIKDGAVLGLITKTVASAPLSVTVGYLETVWN